MGTIPPGHARRSLDVRAAYYKQRGFRVGQFSTRSSGVRRWPLQAVFSTP